MILVDSDILIDALRGAVAAQAWLNSRAPGELVISRVTQLEILVGCRNKTALS